MYWNVLLTLHSKPKNDVCRRYRGMSVVRVQGSTLNVGSDVTIQRYNFFEIGLLEIILHSCNINHLHIYSVYFIFWVAFLFPDVSIIPRTCYFNSPIRITSHVFKTFHFYSNWRSNQSWHIDRKFSQTVYVRKEFITSVWIQVLNSI